MKTDQQQSLMSRFLEVVLRGVGAKNKSRFSDHLNKLTNAMPARPLSHMFAKYDISGDKSLEHTVWTIKPKKDLSDKYVIYLHGGSYMYNFLLPHWMFMGSIVDNTHATVIAPDYPLAPKYHTKDVFTFMLKLYVTLIERVGAKNVTVMGDSAGGGMTLALAQLLSEKNIEQPEQLILLSPCVDVTLNNPAIVELDKDDPILNISAIIEAGKSYAGDLDPKNYLISPIYGNLTGLAPISLYVGTHDLLVADCRKLNDMAKRLEIPFEYYEYEGMVHVGMLYPTPEGGEARDEIIEDIEN